MMELKFFQVDVFTSIPFKGNPVAVVFDADDVPDTLMQQIAAWTNLSETTFVQSSLHSDYKLRIFSPQTEFKFAGHPTLGTLHALIKSGRLDATRKNFYQESRVGIVYLKRDDDILFVKIPLIKPTEFRIGRERLGKIAGCSIVSDAIAFDVGPTWLTAAVRDYSDLYNIRIRTDQATLLFKEYGISGLNFYCIDKNRRVHVRTFAPALGVTEDPVCGSGNAAVAAHIKMSGLSTFPDSEFFTAFQGSALGRDGIVYVRYEDADIYIGGKSVVVIEGTIRL